MRKNFTQHAAKRAAQRGISPQLLEILFCFGIERRVGNGVEIRLNNRRVRRTLCRELRSLVEFLESPKDVYVIEADGVVVTTGHVLRSPDRDRHRHARGRKS